MKASERLAEMVKQLTQAGKRIATAESLTGGLVGVGMTTAPGSSKVYVGGVITYTNDEKIRACGVRSNTIAKFTEVSAQCAAEMAVGILLRTEADYAVSTTGYAGPDGERAGTFFVGFARRYDDGRITSGAHEFHAHGERDAVRVAASDVAMDYVERYAREVSK